jgi:hypothetical protein
MNTENDTKYYDVNYFTYFIISTKIDDLIKKGIIIYDYEYKQILYNKLNEINNETYNIESKKNNVTLKFRNLMNIQRHFIEVHDKVIYIINFIKKKKNNDNKTYIDKLNNIYKYILENDVFEPIDINIFHLDPSKQYNVDILDNFLEDINKRFIILNDKYKLWTNVYLLLLNLENPNKYQSQFLKKRKIMENYNYEDYDNYENYEKNNEIDESDKNKSSSTISYVSNNYDNYDNSYIENPKKISRLCKNRVPFSN